MTARDVIRRLERAGVTVERTRGSHRIYRLGDCRTVVAVHLGDIPIGTLRAIERDMEPCLGHGWLKDTRR